MLSSLPTYLLSVFPLPAGVAKRLENSKGILCGWGWGWGAGGGIGDVFKFHLVNYKGFYAPISNCGLGIENLFLFNIVLLGKWLWQCEGEHNALWSKTIDVKVWHHLTKLVSC